MKRLILAAFVLSGCATEVAVNGETISVWSWSDTFWLMFWVLGVPFVIAYWFWRMPRGYRRSFMPSTSTLSFEKFVMTIEGPQGPIPKSMGEIKGQFITAMQFQAARMARIHKRLGRTL